MADQMDLLREQVKMLAGEVAFCTSSLKRLSEQVAVNPNDTQLQVSGTFIQISATIVALVFVFDS
jgi:centromeric protein E